MSPVLHCKTTYPACIHQISSFSFKMHITYQSRYQFIFLIFPARWFVPHHRQRLFGTLTSPAVVLNSLWAFMAHDLCNYGYLTEVLCCKNTECKHYCIFPHADMQGGALAPPPLWPVGAHPHRLSGTFGFTVCENSLCWAQHSWPVTLVSRSSQPSPPPDPTG